MMCEKCKHPIDEELESTITYISEIGELITVCSSCAT